MSTPEDKLVQLAKEGHPLGLEGVYQRYFEPIYRFCYWQTNRSADAEDLTQDIFIEMAKSIRSFQAKASFKNWLYAIAKNKVNHWLRQKYNLPLAPLLEIIGDTPDWISEQNKLHKIDTIKKLLALLSPKEQQVMQLRYLRGLSVKETAITMKLSENNVKVICHRCIEKIRQKVTSPAKL